MDTTQIILKLAELRKAKGLNQTQIASSLGVSQPYFSAWESGLRPPTHDTLVRWAALLGHAIVMIEITDENWQELSRM